MDKSSFTAKGSTGEITFTGSVVLIRRTGMLGAMRQIAGEGRGNKDIPLSAVTGVRIEPGSFSSKAFFQIIHSGAVQIQGGAKALQNDDNAVFFGNKAMPDFERLKDFILQAIDVGRAPVVAVSSPELVGADFTDTLKKLASLKDAGVLTEEEFAAKKAEILSRL